jgi:hypothetical protein
MEYAVKGEAHDGKIRIVKRGFASEDEAEDHPVRLSLWRRVWVEPIGPRDDGYGSREHSSTGR